MDNMEVPWFVDSSIEGKGQRYLRKDDPLKGNVIYASINGEVEVAKSEIKRVTKNSVLEKIKKGTIIALAIVILAGGVKYLHDKPLIDANNYMSDKVITYLEKSDVDYVITKDGVVLIEEDESKLADLVDVIREDGFDTHQAYYAVSQACGDGALDKIVKAHGYEDAKDFLSQNYFTKELSYDGEGVIGKRSSMKVFENNIESDYIRNVERLQNEAEQILEQGKGLSK